MPDATLLVPLPLPQTYDQVMQNVDQPIHTPQTPVPQTSPQVLGPSPVSVNPAPSATSVGAPHTFPIPSGFDSTSREISQSVQRAAQVPVSPRLDKRVSDDSFASVPKESRVSEPVIVNEALIINSTKYLPLYAYECSANRAWNQILEAHPNDDGIWSVTRKDQNLLEQNH